MSDASKVRELEVENARLKRIVADQMLKMTAMKELLQIGEPMAKRRAVGFLMTELDLSERRSCRIVGLARSVQQYRLVERGGLRRRGSTSKDEEAPQAAAARLDRPGA